MSVLMLVWILIENVFLKVLNIFYVDVVVV